MHFGIRPCLACFLLVASVPAGAADPSSAWFRMHITIQANGRSTDQHSAGVHEEKNESFTSGPVGGNKRIVHARIRQPIEGRTRDQPVDGVAFERQVARLQQAAPARQRHLRQQCERRAVQRENRRPATHQRADSRYLTDKHPKIIWKCFWRRPGCPGSRRRARSCADRGPGRRGSSGRQNGPK